MRSTYIDHGKLRSLLPVLKEWIRLNRLYCKWASWEDCAWWYGERTSIGILAAACWTFGYVTLEEYSTAKGRERKQRTGRCDLSIETTTQRFVCEAKQCWPKPETGLTDAISYVKDTLYLARKDAGDLRPPEGRRLGICFVKPSFSRSQIPFDDCLGDYLTNLQKKVEFDAIAWFFPDKARKMLWDEQIYPGVVLLIREIRRRT